jgi:thiamine kinase-like enzyme
MAALAPPDRRLERVLETVPVWAGATNVRTSPLGGGITNHNFLVEVDGERFVARLAGKDTDLLGIDREAERAAAEAAHGVGIGPQVVAFIPQLGCLVTRFIEAEAIPLDAVREPAMLTRVVAAILAFHQGPALPSTFSPHRVVEAYRNAAEARGVGIPRAYDELLSLSRRIEDAFGQHPVAATPCHNDLLNANFLLAGDRVFVVDYEYAGMGDPFFDLGNFSVNHEFDETADQALVAAYFGDVTTGRVARLKLMRIMSDFREAMWGVVQQGISTLAFDYVGYARDHFARALDLAEDPGVERWLSEARGEAA